MGPRHQLHVKPAVRALEHLGLAERCGRHRADRRGIQHEPEGTVTQQGRADPGTGELPEEVTAGDAHARLRAAGGGSPSAYTPGGILSS